MSVICVIPTLSSKNLKIFELFKVCYKSIQYNFIDTEY